MEAPLFRLRQWLQEAIWMHLGDGHVNALHCIHLAAPLRRPFGSTPLTMGVHLEAPLRWPFGCSPLHTFGSAPEEGIWKHPLCLIWLMIISVHLDAPRRWPFGCTSLCPFGSISDVAIWKHIFFESRLKTRSIRCGCQFESSSEVAIRMQFSGCVISSAMP